MNVGSMSISGLIARDFDIQAVITQLGQIKSRPIKLLEAKQARYAQRLAAHQQLAARVLSLGAAASALTDGSAFAQVSATSADPSTVVVGASPGAPVGGCEIAVTALARAHKIASAPVASTSEALGFAGEFLVNGRVVSVASGDGLADIRDAINAASAGVSASILTVSTGDHRLTISSLTSGVEGAVALIDANASGILESLGLQNSATVVKHPIAGGATGDAFSDRLSPVGDALGLAGAPAGAVRINGADVAIDLAADSLEEIAAAIDSIDGVTASVETVSVDGEAAWRLRVIGDAGCPALTDDGNVLVTLGLLEKTLAHEIDLAQDAQFTIDGVAMTRPSNAVDDAIENVQLQLLGLSGAEGVRVTIERDTAATISAVESFVTAYNRAIDFINQHQSFDTETEQGGLFFGSPAIMNFEATLRRQVSDLVATIPGDLRLASQIGLTFTSSDRLSLDGAALLGALASDPEGVSRLFGVRTSDAAGVEVTGYSSLTPDSGPAGWGVEIAQVATRATATGASLTSGITTDEMLTFNGKSVALTSGMSLQAAADRLNALFAAQHMDVEATVDADRLVITHDLYGAAHALEIVSSLDDGAGGTDLGGATAGEAAVHRGQDVAGTIGGEPATGSGRFLTAADSSPIAGLRLLVTAQEPGAAGVVRLSKGISARLGDCIAATTGENGSLTRAADGVNTEIEAIDEQIARVEADVDRYIQKLQVDFALMEAKMAHSLTLLDWMENQINYLPGSRRDR